MSCAHGGVDCVAYFNRDLLVASGHDCITLLLGPVEKERVNSQREHQDRRRRNKTTIRKPL